MATAIDSILKRSAINYGHPQMVRARLMPTEVRTKKLDDRLYWVAPVILIVEGVHNGLFYPAEELAKFPEAWNGRPLPIQHPEDYNGDFMTANDPEIVEAQNVGTLFNVRFEEGKLKGEAWIDQEKAQDISPETVSIMQAGEILEVSTGLFLEVIPENGDYNGEGYTGIAINYRPDHLALLPGGKGACSVADGAGCPRTNEQEDEDVATRKKTHEDKRKEYATKFQDRLSKIFDNSEIMLSLTEARNEISHTAIRRQIEGLVEKFEENEVVLVREIFDNFFVYEQIMPLTENPTILLKQGYSIDAKETITMSGDPVEVRKKTDFVPVANEENKSAETKEEPIMDRNAQIDALVSNEKSKYEEGDREFLTGLSDEQFEKVAEFVVVNIKAEEAEEAVEEKTSPAADEVNAEPATAKNADEWLEGAPEDVVETFAESKAIVDEKRGELISSISANKQNPYTSEELEAMKLPALKKVAQLARTTDYTGAGGGGRPEANVDEENEILEMPTMTDQEKTG